VHGEDVERVEQEAGRPDVGDLKPDVAAILGWLPTPGGLQAIGWGDVIGPGQAQNVGLASRAVVHGSGDTT
jgi:hypothetical protein